MDKIEKKMFHVDLRDRESMADMFESISDEPRDALEYVDYLIKRSKEHIVYWQQPERSKGEPITPTNVWFNMRMMVIDLESIKRKMLREQHARG